jgi:hypothetical protein
VNNPETHRGLRPYHLTKPVKPGFEEGRKMPRSEPGCSDPPEETRASDFEVDGLELYLFEPKSDLGSGEDVRALSEALRARGLDPGSPGRSGHA